MTREQIYHLQNLGFPSAMTSNGDHWAQVVVLPTGDKLVISGDGDTLTADICQGGRWRPVTRADHSELVTKDFLSRYERGRRA